MNLLINKSVLLLVLSVLPCIGALAQKKQSVPKVYIARVTMIDDTRAKGVLYSIRDTAIVLIPLRKKGTPILDGRDSVVIRTRDVKHIRTKRKASVGRGIFIGLTTGAVVGLGLGAVSPGSCDNAPCLSDGYSAAGGAILGAMTGSIVGGIIGLFPRTFKINGQPLSQEQRTSLEKRALR